MFFLFRTNILKVNDIFKINTAKKIRWVFFENEYDKIVVKVYVNGGCKPQLTLHIYIYKVGSDL